MLKPTNSILVNISMPKEFLKIIDSWADKTSRSRSEFIRESVRNYIIKLTSEYYEVKE